MTGGVDGHVVALLTRDAQMDGVVRWATRHALSHDLALVLAAVTDESAGDMKAEARVAKAAAIARHEAATSDLHIRGTLFDDRRALADQVVGGAMVAVDGTADDGGAIADLVNPDTHTELVPVTVVRGMPGRDALGPAGAVVAGVSTRGPNDLVLEHAFSEASRHGVEIIVTNAWEDTPTHDSALGGTCELDGTPCEEMVALAEVTAGWTEIFPEVVVYRHCVHGDPVDALVRDAERAQLVVIGGPTGDHVAEVWRRIIHRVPRPVTVIPAPGRSVRPPAPDRRNFAPVVR